MVGMRREGGFFVGVVHRHGVKAGFDGLGSRQWELLVTWTTLGPVMVGCGDIIRP